MKYVGLGMTADPTGSNSICVKVLVIALDRNIFCMYKLIISHDIFILMFCNSLEQCKISVGYSYCTKGLTKKREIPKGRWGLTIMEF